LDSRGNPTVEIDVFTDTAVGRASAPAGASRGKYEVVAYPQNNINLGIEIFRKDVVPKLLNIDVEDQTEIDSMLHQIDSTTNFSRIGGNISVAVSMAVAKTAAKTYGMPLYQYIGGKLANVVPYPLGNIIGGGKHAVGGTDIQEYLVISFAPIVEAVFANVKVHMSVKKILKTRFEDIPLGKGDEGAWVSQLSNIEALDILSTICKEVSDDVKFKLLPAIDFASSEFFDKGKYHYKDQVLNTEEQISFVADLVDKYNLHIIEDPLEQTDFKGYAELTKTVGNKCLVVGDDLFVTNKDRLQKGIDTGAANAILIKPNQIGTLTDVIETVTLAKENDYEIIISHRSGETEDSYIAHLAVAFGSYAIKTGTIGGERTAKLNELIRIEEMLRTAKTSESDRCKRCMNDG
jgi:enolase